MRQHVPARWFFLLAISPLLGSCISTPAKKSVVRTQLIKPAQPLKLKTPPPELTIEQNTHWNRVAPASYQQWLQRGSHEAQVNRYYNFLIRHEVSRAVPMFELVRSARDWERCGSEPYAVPSSDLWDNLLPTLKVVQQLGDKDILDDIEITSVYRDAALNQCANGAPGSKHVHNSALDFRIGRENPQPADLEKIARAKHKLCEFWQQNGERLNMGLGLYASGQIHIDTEGFRTWGPDHTRNTSICAA